MRVTCAMVGPSGYVDLLKHARQQVTEKLHVMFLTFSSKQLYKRKYIFFGQKVTVFALCIGMSAKSTAVSIIFGDLDF